MNLLDAIELHLPAGFAIEGRLGEGATSWVYLARNETSGERLVVKVMRPGMMTAERARRFFSEMRVLSKLGHPRIIPILEPGEAEGLPFFTMPYVAGETLRTRLQGAGRLPVREALVVARDVAGAVEHAHQHGVVHRDIKPENVLLAGDGGAYLMDFGFAQTAGAAAAYAAAKGTRLVVGTPDYMSPEQISGKGAADWRSDFFSLGCVLFEMLAGRAPFPAAGGSRAAAARRFDAPAPDVRELRPEVPEDVAHVVARSLALAPSDRYDTAFALRGALEAALGRLDLA
ncbi:MAG: serine/threonine-protein kinase [Gemmatimonadaceae bacterium]